MKHCLVLHKAGERVGGFVKNCHILEKNSMKNVDFPLETSLNFYQQSMNFLLISP